MDSADAEIEKLSPNVRQPASAVTLPESDQIRKELAERGIIIEDSKDGSVRWKRK